MTLERALADDSLKERYETDDDVKSIVDLARKLEGLARNAGRHAGGVVIAPGRLTEFTALYREPGAVSAVTQFDKDDIEAIGLVKFDFLGLRTLTIIDWTLATVNERRRSGAEAPLDLESLSTDDPATYELIRSGATTAVFQLESRGMRDLVRRLLPDCFDDVIALVAPVPPRPAPIRNGRGLHRAQARSGGGRVPAPGARIHSQADLRGHPVSGAGDADCSGARRLHAGRGRSAAPRDGQEEARGDGRAPRRVRGRRDEPGGGQGPGHVHLRPDGKICRIRLQQVAFRRVRAAGVPDRVAQGAPSRRIHGGGAVRRHGQHRQGRQPGRGVPLAGPRRCAAARQRMRLPLQRGRRAQRPVRARRDQGGRRSCARERHRRTQAERALHGPLRLRPPHRSQEGQSARGGSPRTSRRARRAGAPPVRR